MSAGRNLLHDATSLYLLQHAGNPVHWRPWGEAALQEARRLQRPILVSVGYAACHWCHVMARESFEDSETAALINRFFVAIKVDREERPDIDQFCVSAMRALDERPGWPTTLFLTPEAEAFWGGTYFPREARAGQLSFRQVLERVAAAFAASPDKVARIADTARRALAGSTVPRPGDPPRGAELGRVTAAILQRLDPVHGGLAGAPKFPDAPLFRFLWQDSSRSGDPAGAEAVRVLLHGLSQGGIYDHLGGGYARYAIDAAWQVPHFEKMLCDNAQILELLTFAHAARPDPLLAARAEGTVGWLLREMRVEDAFASAQAAESEGEEGRFYCWDAAEIDAVLGAAAGEDFRATYGVTPAGNWEGRNVLRCVAPPHLGDALLSEARARLFAHRARRPPPERDDKVLADWNGLTIVALARAAQVFRRPEWLDVARTTFRFLQGALEAKDGRIAHAWRLGRRGAAGLLEDQAALGRAALALFEATAEDSYLADAIRYAEAAKRWFAHPSGGYRTAAIDATDVPPGQPLQAQDHATPSGNGQLAGLFAGLFHLTGQEGWRADADRLIRAFAGDDTGLVIMPTLLAAADLLERGGLLVIAAPSGDSIAEEMLATAWAKADPALLVLRVTERTALGPSHPAHGKTAIGGAAAAYLCRAGTCSLPARDSTTLRHLLASAEPASGSRRSQV